ncbi:MAG: nicotinate phosphoribosyltransferase [Synergistales bacterium]|nr:nicotinate phosphoribosyltransferase [Synergistales bacterium]MDY6401611.1 nicotinate phosphoribosyltransferase [Synergistales bacterium]MDY6404307.1 nicotinate phosphoribosyltransferase [Synergistales bacterium]MDY6410679.1 nicotinate phosphoribosyltransferase [Synergistales bacterium]MDY6414008.1 nicotinate phosphoribosyltransferase [Synergistales bacterium]
MKVLNSLKDVTALKVNPARLYSATHDEIKSGATTDIYFINTRDVLNSVNMLDTPVVAEIFTRTTGMFAGLAEVLELLKGAPVKIEAIPEGEYFSPKEVLVRITGPYGAFGYHETDILGILSSSCAWASAARECVEAAEGKSVLSFGARHLHPAISPVMEAIAVKFGGCSGASCVLGAKLAGREPSGTVPHAAILIMGDTLKLAEAYDAALPPEIGRTFLVDTFHDECEEALRLARAMGDRLDAVRLDTPGERGGVTPDLVKELRYRLDKEGFNKVKIVVSGGLNPERIKILAQAGADVFGVGSYIAHAVPMDMTMDLKEINGKPLAKRGRLPGKLENKRLINVK